ncbi:hypothetical protein YC2023_059862 [Brassica napus]
MSRSEPLYQGVDNQSSSDIDSNELQNVFFSGKTCGKEFDVRITAGGSTKRAVHREYKANGAYGPIISAVSATPDFRPTVDNKPPSKRKNRTGIIVGLGLLSILTGVGIFIIRKRRKPYTDDEELLSMEIKPFTFTYSELKSATQDFNLSNKLGEGGFEPVYKLTSRGPVDKKVIQWLLSLHQIGLDVNRTDRSLEIYEKKENLSKLWDILCLCLDRPRCRSVGVEAQLTHLSSITQIIDPKLHQHLGDYLCAIRMLMVQFRREFSFCDSLYLWEMMWALEYDPDLFHVYEAHQCGSEKVEVSNGKPKSMSQCGKDERQNLRNGGKNTEGPLPISVFLVASVLKDKSSKLMTEARGLDDVVKILNDMSGNLDAKKTCSGAIKIHKKYLRKAKK